MGHYTRFISIIALGDEKIEKIKLNGESKKIKNHQCTMRYTMVLSHRSLWAVMVAWLLVASVQEIEAVSGVRVVAVSHAA